jgi:hypothetical protein
MSEAGQSMIEKLYLDLTVRGSHRDSLSRSLVFK